MKHLKRQGIPKKWPIEKKGTKWVVSPNSNIRNGIPLLIVLRDILKIAQNRKEVKQALHEKFILVNNKHAIDDRISLALFDTLAIVPSKKYYKIVLSKYGKFALEEIKESEINSKISKVIDKKMLKGKKTQLNLLDGRNFISNVKCNVGDSAVIDFKNRKIEKCLSLKEKAKAIAYTGKHIGEIGSIEKINLERKMAKIKTKDKEINVLIKQLMAIE
jgi:small subunit ribosomal protein S4e